LPDVGAVITLYGMIESGQQKIVKLNHILDALNINANCTNYQKIRNFSIYDLNLLPGSRIKDIQKYINEISIYLKTKNKPLIKICSEQGLVRLELMDNDPSKILFFDEIIDQKIPDYTMPMYLGDATDGQKIWMDMAENPHLLIAGTTGSGKSTLLHNIIANSIINDNKLFLIDTKNIEFNEYGVFKNIEVISSYEDSLELFDYLISTMERRYDFLAKKKLPSSYFKQQKPYVPHILLVIDEFADLILHDDSKELQKKITKLAQKSRAAGIHLVVATQRPSADILNGAIKANFPARIACKVASHTDSKVILDAVGAECLYGYGDAIIKNYIFNFVRFQTAFTNQSTNIEYLKK